MQWSASTHTHLHALTRLRPLSLSPTMFAELPKDDEDMDLLRTAALLVLVKL